MVLLSRIHARVRDGRLVPLVDITILISRREISMVALVDSGSTRTIVPGDLLEQHGIAFESLGDPRTGSGVGGEISFKVADGQMDWRGLPFASAFAVAEPGRLPLALVGREDFMRALRVCFDWTGERPFMDIEPAA